MTRTAFGTNDFGFEERFRVNFLPGDLGAIVACAISSEDRTPVPLGKLEGLPEPVDKVSVYLIPNTEFIEHRGLGWGRKQMSTAEIVNHENVFNRYLQEILDVKRGVNQSVAARRG